MADSPFLRKRVDLGFDGLALLRRQFGLKQLVEELHALCDPAFAVDHARLHAPIVGGCGDLSSRSVASVKRSSLWKLVGLAGLAGVAATGVAVARSERERRAYTPEEVRARLQDRMATLDVGQGVAGVESLSGDGRGRRWRRRRSKRA